MSGFFITGTDTNVGKTLASAIVTSVLNACYWKPVQSGIASEPSDQDRLIDWLDLPSSHFHPSNYALKACLSPDQAAALEGVRIDVSTLKLPQKKQQLIVEGAGGVFCPITDDFSMLDLMKQLNLPVIVVCRGTLGTINHTLLTIEALLHRHLSIKGLIFCGELNHANKNTIEKWSGIKTLFHIPYFDNLTKASLQSWIADNKADIREVLL
jgi:dethiobiotin synthase